MRVPFQASFRALAHPGSAFPIEPPPLGRALFRMALVWMPLALLNTAATVWRALQSFEGLRSGATPLPLLGWFGWDPAAVPEALAALPPTPAFTHIWPWLCLWVPLGVLGTWLHHAVWDHTGLWLLGGLGQRRGFRTSLLAEAEALRITALGTLVGLLGFLPWVGAWLALPLLLLDGYLWLFRGVALAARHGCEPWRGVAATIVHAALLGCCAGGLLGFLILMLRMGS